MIDILGVNGVKLNEDTFGEPSQNITLSRIRKALKDRLRKRLPDKNNDELNEILISILKTHGLDKDNFDFLNVIGSLFSEKLNDVSIDDNSNKNEKTVKGILQEGSSPLYKALGYDFLYRVIKSIYGKREAKRLTSLMYDMSLGLSDSTNILLPYCWALDASKIVTIGRDFGQLKSKPAKRISSYISALCETIHQMSNHLAGALAIGTFFLDVCHLLMKEYDLNSIKTDKNVRKKIENEYQQFLHSVNHLSRNGSESPFTNLSIFDKTKLRVLIKDMDWYLLQDHDTEYVLDYIMELQHIFLEFFDKGDPSSNGMPYRFPVCTINVSKHLENGEYVITEPDYIKEICEKYDIYRYNIFTSEGTKISSCCFKGDEIIKVKMKDKNINISLKDFVKLNGDKEKYIEEDWKINSLNPKTLKTEQSNIKGILKKKNDFNILITIKMGNDKISVTPDHVFMAKNIKTNKIEEITAEYLKYHYNSYMLPVL